MPGEGLLIWHVDNATWTNTDEHHPKVKLMHADAIVQLNGNCGRGDAGDVFPGIANKINFGQRQLLAA
jgi:immune inhibitor A